MAPRITTRGARPPRAGEAMDFSGGRGDRPTGGFARMDRHRLRHGDPARQGRAPEERRATQSRNRGIWFKARGVVFIELS